MVVRRGKCGFAVAGPLRSRAARGPFLRCIEFLKFASPAAKIATGMPSR